MSWSTVEFIDWLFPLLRDCVEKYPGDVCWWSSLVSGEQMSDFISDIDESIIGGEILPLLFYKKIIINDFNLIFTYN